MTRDWKDVKAEKVEHDALVSRVAEVLSEHDDLPGIECCRCGFRYVRSEACGAVDPHAAHLATVLAELIQSERAAAAVEALESAATAMDEEGGWETPQGWLRDRAASVRIHDARCITLTNSEHNVFCDCETWRLIDESAATYRSTNTTPTKENDHG